MTTIYAMCGQKGGIGRTTIAVSLAAHWLEKGRKVLLVDSDPQRTASTWVEIAVEHNRPAPTSVYMGATLWKPDQLPKIAPQFDIVIIDTPPRLGDVQRAALMIADVALLPCGPSAHDCWAMAESVELINQARIVRPEIGAAIVLTRKVARTVVGREAREVLAESGLPVLGIELGYRIDYQEASAAGAGVTTHAPTSFAASELRQLAAELELLARGRKVRATRAARAAVAATERR